MEKQKIYINSISQDVVIGNVFNDLFTIIKQSKQNNNSVVWDFTNTFYLHPFLLFALAVYKYQNNIECINIKENPNIQRYLELVCFENLYKIKDTQSLEQELSNYYSESYIPICFFDINNNFLKQFQTSIQTIIERQCQAQKISTPLSYFIGELMDNIREHSSADKGFVFSQYLQNERCLNICIADNGITVLGSYYKTNKYLEIIHNNPAIALSQALSGLSTNQQNEVLVYHLRKECLYKD
ncbi:MAG: hypothetical protein IJ180_01025 [Bacteroidales bacterium]|nr:hypothetical protein [Bacteroidales bacterium]